VPSTQTPPIAGGAIDPPSLRPPIEDAAIERVDAAGLRARLEELHAQGWTMLLDVGAADYPLREPRFDVVYHFLKLSPEPDGVVRAPARLRVLCGVDAARASVPTASDLWPNANWAEREVYDLFGISFEGHPDMRRIQMPHTWEGHPLRKDYPLRGPARERSPRPAFALKSNVQAGTPPSGETLAALQEQRKERRP
jgi:NADH:ubiquinone oxidoreductase subunit C